MAEPESRKKILLAVDGSGMATATVNYVASTMPPAETDVVLFHVFSKIPETFWDREREPELDPWMDKMRAQEREHEKAILEFMQTSQKTLLDAGFREQRLVVKIQNRIAGIARDIVAESKRGYDMLVMGRTGTSRAEGVRVGSVAYKVLGALQDLTVAVITGSPKAPKILVALDGSGNSMRAVTFLSSLRNISSRQVLLFHAIRRIGFPQIGEGGANPISELEQAIFEDARKMIEPSLKAAESQLVAAGCRPENIAVKIASGVVSRSGALLAEAKTNHCGSIVVGRKGISQIEDFNVGRVCHKVIQQAQDMAVWVVP